MASKRKFGSQDAAAMTRGAARRAHFAAGGTVAAWQGRNSRVQDGRKVASRIACRQFCWRGEE